MKGAMGRTAIQLSADVEITVMEGSIAMDVHTGVGNFLGSETPSQDIVTVSSGGNDGGSVVW
jgi:hypothetical protein